MGLFDLKSQIKPYAYDIKQNIVRLFIDHDLPGLSQEEVCGISLAAAYSIHSKELTSYIEMYVEETLSKEKINNIKTVVTIQTMKNVYNRSIYMAENEELRLKDPRLDKDIYLDLAITEVDLHYYSLAVAFVFGSKISIQQEIDKAISLHGNMDAVHSIIRIASVLHASEAALRIS